MLKLVYVPVYRYVNINTNTHLYVCINACINIMHT